MFPKATKAVLVVVYEILMLLDVTSWPHIQMLLAVDLTVTMSYVLDLSFLIVATKKVR
jgi:hypothetical protein